MIMTMMMLRIIMTDDNQSLLLNGDNDTNKYNIQIILIMIIIRKIKITSKRKN